MPLRMRWKSQPGYSSAKDARLIQPMWKNKSDVRRGTLCDRLKHPYPEHVRINYNSNVCSCWSVSGLGRFAERIVVRRAREYMNVMSERNLAPSIRQDA